MSAPPLARKKILFHDMIHSGDVTAEDMQTVLYPAKIISPGWIAIKGNVAVEPSYHIN